MHQTQDSLPLKSLPLAITSVTSELDLVALGGCEKGAIRVWVTGAGLVWLVGFDGAGAHFPLDAYTTDLALSHGFKELAFGNVATKLCTGGAYPAVLATAQSIVLRLDEGTIKDTGDVTVAFAIGSHSLAAIVAAINAAVSAELGESVTVASNVSGQLQIVGRAHGTAGAVEIVSIGATLATATGLSVATTNGTATNAATGTVVIDW